MKKIILLILITFNLSAQVSRNRLKAKIYSWSNRLVPSAAYLDSSFKSFVNIVDDGKPWSIIGNSVSTSTNFIGTTSNFPFLLKTNNASRLKIGEDGIITTYSTASTSTVDGSFWYDAINNGFTYFTKPSASNYNSVWTNSLVSGGVTTYTPSNYKGFWIGATTNDNLHLFVKGDAGGTPALTVCYNSPTVQQGILVNGSANNYTCNAQLEVRQGAGNNIFQLDNVSGNNLLEVKSNTGDLNLLTGSIKTNGFSASISTQTTSYTALLTDHTILSTGTTTITLPTASSSAGKVYSIKNIGVNTLTVKGNGSELIDASNTWNFTTQYRGFSVQSNGSQFFIISTF